MYENIIVIPYRNRPSQLKHFIDITGPKLLKVLKNSKIIIVEQLGDSLFNRGILLNIGCLLHKHTTNYFILHDIDLEPSNEVIQHNYYPKLTKYDVRGIYNNSKTLGGIIKLKHDVYMNSNGHPNNFWGWGCEDMDFMNRVKFRNYTITKTYIKNCSGTNQHLKSKFLNLDSKNTRNKSQHYNVKHNYVYNNFHKLSNIDKEKYILRSGLNNIKYKVVKNIQYQHNIQHIFVNV